jgi:hypothetical protein
MAVSPKDIRILFTNYDIIAYFLNLVFWSEHFIGIQDRILVTFNIDKKKSVLTACMHLKVRGLTTYKYDHENAHLYINLHRLCFLHLGASQ